VLIHVVHNKGANPGAIDLNKATAIFMKDLLSVMDRGFVMELIHYHVTHIDRANGFMSTVSLKYTFLRIITDYEHFIPINIPLFIPVESVAQLKSQYLYAITAAALLLCSALLHHRCLLYSFLTHARNDAVLGIL